MGLEAHVGSPRALCLLEFPFSCLFVVKNIMKNHDPGTSGKEREGKSSEQTSMLDSPEWKQQTLERHQDKYDGWQDV